MTAAQTVWRVSVVGRVSGVAFALAFLAGGIWYVGDILRSGGTLTGDGPTLAFLLVGLVLALRLSVYPSVKLTDDEVIVRNPMRTHHLPLNEIVAVEAGYYGVVICMQDGFEVPAWAVQKANITAWLGRRTRGDIVVEAIRDAARDAGAPIPLRHRKER